MPEGAPLPPSEAATLLRDAAPAPVSEPVALEEALGRVLAADVASLCDHPTVDESALDGYACRVEDTAGAGAQAPVRLRVVGEAPAGRPYAGSVGAGETVRIFTGAVLPEGADGIVAVEASREPEDAPGTVELLAEARPGDVRRQGQDLVEGQVYLPRGRRLHAGSVGLAAAMGHARLPVARRPRVALLTTGDEVVPPGGPLARGQVYDSNGASLMALGRAAGADMVRLPAVADDPEALGSALRKVGGVDLLLTSGGVSMGRYDLVRELLFERGNVVFWKVAMKPGGPALFGRFEDTAVLGLPGNPVSSMVVFLVLARAFIDAALGRSDPSPYFDRRWAVAGAKLHANATKESLLRVTLAERDGRWLARPLTNQSSGVLRSMAAADALALVAPGRDVASGENVPVIPLAPHLG